MNTIILYREDGKMMIRLLNHWENRVFSRDQNTGWQIDLLVCKIRKIAIFSHFFLHFPPMRRGEIEKESTKPADGGFEFWRNIDEYQIAIALQRIKGIEIIFTERFVETKLHFMINNL